MTTFNRSRHSAANLIFSSFGPPAWVETLVAVASFGSHTLFTLTVSAADRVFPCLSALGGSHTLPIACLQTSLALRKARTLLLTDQPASHLAFGGPGIQFAVFISFKVLCFVCKEHLDRDFYYLIKESQSLSTSALQRSLADT